MHFSPSTKKEIFSEKPAEIAKDNSASENEIDINKLPEKIEDTVPLKNTDPIKEAPSNTENSEKKTANDFKIIQKPVSWGYTASKNRTIDTIVIHSSYNALGGDKYDLDKLISEYKSYGVSPHYLIDRSGNTYQLVSNQNIAYHAGESKMPDGRTNVNNFSLGIEIMTTQSDSPTDAQYASLTNLISNIKESYKIKNILGHSQIASGRKTDPWNFSWSKID